MKIKFYREKMKLSQRELANKLNTTQATLQRYESGIHQPNIETIIKLADFFQISIDDLIGRESQTINLNFYDNDKKELIGYLSKEDDKTIERVYDFYKGLKDEKWRKIYGNQFYNINSDKYNLLANNINRSLQNTNTFKIPSFSNQAYEQILHSPTREEIEELKNDPYFKNLNNDNTDNNK